MEYFDYFPIYYTFMGKLHKNYGNRKTRTLCRTPRIEWRALLFWLSKGSLRQL